MRARSGPLTINAACPASPVATEPAVAKLSRRLRVRVTRATCSSQQPVVSTQEIEPMKRKQFVRLREKLTVRELDDQ